MNILKQRSFDKFARKGIHSIGNFYLRQRVVRWFGANNNILQDVIEHNEIEKSRFFLFNQEKSVHLPRFMRQLIIGNTALATDSILEEIDAIEKRMKSMSNEKNPSKFSNYSKINEDDIVEGQKVLSEFIELAKKYFTLLPIELKIELLSLFFQKNFYSHHFFKYSIPNLIKDLPSMNDKQATLAIETIKEIVNKLYKNQELVEKGLPVSYPEVLLSEVIDQESLEFLVEELTGRIEKCNDLKDESKISLCIAFSEFLSRYSKKVFFNYLPIFKWANNLKRLTDTLKLKNNDMSNETRWRYLLLIQGVLDWGVTDETIKKQFYKLVFRMSNSSFDFRQKTQLYWLIIKCAGAFGELDHKVWIKFREPFVWSKFVKPITILYDLVSLGVKDDLSYKILLDRITLPEAALFNTSLQISLLGAYNQNLVPVVKYPIFTQILNEARNKCPCGFRPELESEDLLQDPSKISEYITQKCPRFLSENTLSQPAQSTRTKISDQIIEEFKIHYKKYFPETEFEAPKYNVSLCQYLSDILITKKTSPPQIYSIEISDRICFNSLGRLLPRKNLKNINLKSVGVQAIFIESYNESLHVFAKDPENRILQVSNIILKEIEKKENSA